MGRRLFDIIIKKQSNLAVAADVTTVADLLSIADKASNLKLQHLRTLCSSCGACVHQDLGDKLGFQWMFTDST